MVATARITIRVFVTFSDCKESNATKPSRERMGGYDFPYNVIIEIYLAAHLAHPYVLTGP